MTQAPEDKPKLRVAWYRCPVGREDLAALNKRSDFKGFLQAGGYLGYLALTGTLAVLSPFFVPSPWVWVVTPLLVLFHGMGHHFLINGFHELVHDSVFKTQFLNTWFLRVHSFLGWHNHHLFWASHTEHHKYTLHPPDDLEVVLPLKVALKDVFRGGIVNPQMFWGALKGTIRVARGRLEGEWENALFPESKSAERRALFNWARIVLVGHALIFAAAIYFKLWVLPFVVTFPMCFLGCVHTFCNASQHIGLRDNVTDFRLCCRTIYLNPYLRFLYWNMNYHTEHHMFAAVPCYNLRKLHSLIKSDMPHCPNGLIETWKQIFATLEKQKQDPAYQFTAELPTPSVRRSAAGGGEATPAVAG